MVKMVPALVLKNFTVNIKLCVMTFFQDGPGCCDAAAFHLNRKCGESTCLVVPQGTSSLCAPQVRCHLSQSNCSFKYAFSPGRLKGMPTEIELNKFQSYTSFFFVSKSTFSQVKSNIFLCMFF